MEEVRGNLLHKESKTVGKHVRKSWTLYLCLPHISKSVEYVADLKQNKQ